VNLPFGAFAEEAGQITASGIDARVLHLIGQSDLAVSIASNEFRKFLDVKAPYPSRRSRAFSLNWNFAVPFEFERPERKARWNVSRPPSRQDDAPLYFFLHLRFRRSVFAYTDAEVALVHKIRALLKAHKINAAILAGLGWSDVIVDGTTAVSRIVDFTHFLLKVHELYLPLNDQKLPALQRTLTIFGYPPNAVPSAAGLRHVTFARTLPGRYQRGREVLEREFAPTLYRTSFIDGKSDFMIHLPETPAPHPLLRELPTPGDDPTFFRKQQALGDNAAGTASEGAIQRLESHLELIDVNDLPPFDEADLALWPDARSAAHVECSCATHSYDLDRYTRPFYALPRGLQQAINNLLFLFAAALKDATTCCDSYPAIVSCEQSLTTLLESFDSLLEVLPRTKPLTKEQVTQLGLDESFASVDAQLTESERLLAIYPEGINVNALLAERYKYMEDWHAYAERVLSQRTVGSFEEMLGRTDRVTTYRGGAQKFLYLADGLVRDFAKLIPRTNGLSFATLYDSVHTIMGVRGSHFIRIPVRHVFTLPLGVADLWHEVGVAIFNLRYDAEKVAQAAADSNIDADELYETLGDAYGDFIVFLFGFRGNFGRFADSLIKGWRASRIPGGMLIPHEVLTRLYLVLELAWARHTAQRQPAPATPTDHASRLVGYLRRLVLQRYSKSTNDLLRANKRVTWRTLMGRVTQDEFRRYRARIHDFLDATIPPRQDFSLKDILEGRAIELPPSADLNALFADYVAMWASPTARTKLPLFRSMAALGKSVSRAYFRRAATRETPPATTPTRKKR
jgi:hypothetical protein